MKQQGSRFLRERVRKPVREPVREHAIAATTCAGGMLSVLSLFVIVGLASAASPAFYQAWSDGRGEVNVYRLVEERYGDPRDGHAVLIYVAEELNADTYVKVESDRTPPEKRMFVLKLNSLKKFPTGLYDYATMTTVFSVPESHLGFPPFQAARVTHTTQEWCGQVWQRLDLRRDGWHIDLRSYFEREADQSTVLPAEGTDLEDNLWIKIRELDAPWLVPGESRSLKLVPSTWELRKTHQPASVVPVVIQKRDREPIDTALGKLEAYVWTWSVGARSVTAWVEVEGAHRLLAWTDSNGGHAEIVESNRVTYWEKNDDEDFTIRRDFRLPDQKLLR